MRIRIVLVHIVIVACSTHSVRAATASSDVILIPVAIHIAVRCHRLALVLQQASSCSLKAMCMPALFKQRNSAYHWP
jgi:hypothetical protein